MTREYDIRDKSLSARGARRIEWAWQEMPVLQAMRIQIDDLTEQQRRYLTSWQKGTA